MTDLPAVIAGVYRADWLGAPRARAYLRLLAAAMLILAGAVIVYVWRSTLSDPQGRPTISDFCAFWAAARLTLGGHPAAAYTEPAIRAAELLAAQPSGAQYLPYVYPPVFTLYILPLGLLGYLPALALFALGGGAACACCLRAILPRRFPTLAILAFPGLVMNAAIGQNGFLSTIAFSGAMLLLDRAPLLGGACLGTLVYKPQLAFAIPVALVFARRWRSLAAFCGVALGLVLLSWAAFGSAAWAGFMASAPLLRAVLLSPQILPKLLSLFAAMRVLHAGVAVAAAVQIAGSVVALACLAAICARRPGAGPEVAALVAAAFLCTPYLMDYDLLCLGVPLAWLAGRGSQAGWLPWEKAGLIAVYVLPFVARTLTMTGGVPVAPLALAGLLALAAQRVAAA